MLFTKSGFPNLKVDTLSIDTGIYTFVRSVGAIEIEGGNIFNCIGYVDVNGNIVEL